jgi:hypothetical protein
MVQLPGRKDLPTVSTRRTGPVTQVGPSRLEAVGAALGSVATASEQTYQAIDQEIRRKKAEVAKKLEEQERLQDVVRANEGMSNFNQALNDQTNHLSENDNLFGAPDFLTNQLEFSKEAGIAANEAGSKITNPLTRENYFAQIDQREQDWNNKVGASHLQWMRYAAADSATAATQATAAGLRASPDLVSLANAVSRVPDILEKSFPYLDANALRDTVAQTQYDYISSTIAGFTDRGGYGDIALAREVLKDEDYMGLLSVAQRDDLMRNINESENRLRSQANAQRKIQIEAVTANFPMMLEGKVPANFPDIAKAVEVIGDSDLTAEFMATNRTMATVREAILGGPVQLNSIINQVNNLPNTPENYNLVNYLEAAREKQIQGLEEDPVGYGIEIGLISHQEIDFDDPSSWVAAAENAAIVQESFRLMEGSVPILSNAQINALADRFSSPDATVETQVNTLQLISHAPISPESKSNIFNNMGNYDQTVGFLGAMVLYNPGQVERILQGQESIRNNLQLKPNSAQTNDIFDEALGNVFRADATGENLANTIFAVNGLYVSKAIASGRQNNPFDENEDLYREAIDEILPLANSPVNRGFWYWQGNQDYVLPPNVTEEQMKNLFSNINQGHLHPTSGEREGTGPHFFDLNSGNFEAVSAESLGKEYFLETVGQGIYRLTQDVGGERRSLVTPDGEEYRFNYYEMLEQVSTASSDMMREDGTIKGRGYFGELKRLDGNVSTEISIGVIIDGVETLIPSLVPTLTPDEINTLLNLRLPDGDQPGEDIPEEIQRKAKIHAEKRIEEGQPVWATSGEETYIRQRVAPDFGVQDTLGPER